MDNNNLVTLESLKNQTFQLGKWDPINKKEFTVSDFKQGNSNTIIFTNKRTFNLLNSEVSDFLKDIIIVESKNKQRAFLPKTPSSVPSTKDSPEQKVNLTIFEPTDAQKKTQTALSDMLDKVLAGEKDAIPKAKAICDIANTMVNMEKSQIQLMQLATKKR